MANPLKSMKAVEDRLDDLDAEREGIEFSFDHESHVAFVDTEEIPNERPIIHGDLDVQAQILDARIGDDW